MKPPSHTESSIQLNKKDRWVSGGKLCFDKWTELKKNHKIETRQGTGCVKMIKLLVSACLMGEHVRYNGGAVKILDRRLLECWQGQDRVVLFCPEVAGGLMVPRPCSEISHGDGKKVLCGDSRVINIHGNDVTESFLKGAQKAVELARSMKIRMAVLKDGSPSCGSAYIYDGRFAGIKKPGKGVTAALLEENDIRVFSEREIPKASEYLKTL